MNVNENGVVALSKSNLAFNDVDTNNATLRYVVTAAPLYGTLKDQHGSVTSTFLQSDIEGTVASDPFCTTTRFWLECRRFFTYVVRGGEERATTLSLF